MASISDFFRNKFSGRGGGKSFFSGLFKGVPTSFLGVDVGTSSVKVVELEQERGRAKLVTYGEAGTYYALEKLTDVTSLKSHQITDVALIQLIKDLIKASKVRARTAVFSVPISSSFSTIMEFPAINENEIERAVEYEARQYVPIPLSEVKMSWHIIKNTEDRLIPQATQPQKNEKEKREQSVEVLLVAVPNEIISRYQNIAKNTGLEIVGMELESFSAVRSVLGNDKMVAIMVDIGAHTTDISLVDNGIIKMNHNLDIGGSDVTRVISQSLNIPMVRAEELKKNFGLKAEGGEKEVSNLMYPVLDLIVLEVQKMIDATAKKHKSKTIDRIILIGGTSVLPGIAEYFSSRLNVAAVPANPFSRIVYPAELEGVLREVGPAYSTAVGLALRNLMI